MTDLWSRTELKLYAMRKSRDGVIISFVIHPDDVSKKLIAAPIGTRYLAALVEIEETAARIESPTLPAREISLDRPSRSLAKLAGILCNDAPFWRFLGERNPGLGIVEDHTDAAAIVHQICGVSSRKQFDSDPAAAERWRQLVAEFEAWKA